MGDEDKLLMFQDQGSIPTHACVCVYQMLPCSSGNTNDENKTFTILIVCIEFWQCQIKISSPSFITIMDTVFL